MTRKKARNEVLHGTGIAIGVAAGAVILAGFTAGLTAVKAAESAKRTWRRFTTVHDWDAALITLVETGTERETL